jgi:hypothetical protein
LQRENCDGRAWRVASAMMGRNSLAESEMSAGSCSDQNRRHLQRFELGALRWIAVLVRYLTTNGWGASRRMGEISHHEPVGDMAANAEKVL